MALERQPKMPLTRAEKPVKVPSNFAGLLTANGQKQRRHAPYKP